MVVNLVGLAPTLKRRRKELGLTYAEIAEATEVCELTVRRWENGKIQSIRYDKLDALAKILQVNPEVIVGWEEPAAAKFQCSQFRSMPEVKEWEFIGGTPCDDPSAPSSTKKTLIAPADIDADYIFYCRGNSMIDARIADGDIVFIKIGEVVNGQIGVVRINDHYTLKRIYRHKDYLELRGESPSFPPIIISDEHGDTEIIGRAVCFQSYL